MVLAESNSLEGTSLVRRLHPDGAVDRTFEWPLQGNDRPLLALPDGSVLVERREQSPNPNYSLLTIMKITPQGVQDSGWTAQLEASLPWDGGFPTKIVLQADGSLLGIMEYGGNRRGRTRLFRLNLDGSIDRTFDASVAGSSPVTVVRLSATGLQPGHQYQLVESPEDEGRSPQNQGLRGGVDYPVGSPFIFQGQGGQTATLGEIPVNPATTQHFWRLQTEE